MLYLLNTNWLMRCLYPGCIWRMPKGEKKLYLTFDDGPHPGITSFVLDTLKKYNAKATFFCIGKNVAQHPETYNRILAEGHATGNHTHNHLNGWKTTDEQYISNIEEAGQYITGNLYRPPYGRISRRQIRTLKDKLGFNIIMWSVLSGDFDTSITAKKCYDNVQRNVGNGSIIVFHDSEKAYERLQYALPQTLEHFSNKGYVFDKITLL